REQSMARAEPGLDAVVPFNHQRRFVRQLADLKGMAKTSPAFFGIADFQRTTHEANAAAASPRQMTDRLVRALIIVADHRILGQLWIGAHDQNERNIDL